MGFFKGVLGIVLLMVFLETFPEVVSSDTVFLGLAIIIGGAVVYSGKD